MLEKDTAVTTHDKNLQLLMTEIFKTLNSFNTTFMKEIFLSKNSKYDLSNKRPIKLLRSGGVTSAKKHLFSWGKVVA